MSGKDSSREDESPAPRPNPNEHVVVGIGASAGGIRALKDFFGAVPADSGMSYVVILHLSPDHESNLAHVLQTTTSIPVTQVRERERVVRDHVYVVPPNRKLALVDGHIEVSDIKGVEERRAPIDIFFRTLADVEQSRAVSVILSGTGADGSMGMKRVKEYGGLCVAQDPDDAEFPDMPRAAIATNLIDYVLPAARIPQRLISFQRHAAAIELEPGEGGGEHEKALLDVFTQLRVRTGHDFTNYKRTTVLRRVERRMNVHELPALPDYARYLKENREESRALLKDLLISVTNFFRDPEAFAALERTIIPKLFEGRGPEDHVRVWVAGCATGEEAYSIAMLLAEHVPTPVAGPTVQVFATDIDEAALSKARAGVYTLNDAADVSPDRLRRFFVKEGDGYRVRRELREMVLFAAHNAIKDPPFSHLDLVTCRNLLIYLNRAAQDRIVKLVHFGLNPGGYLFLGTSESVEEIGNLFAPVDKDHHIYQSRAMDTPLSVPPVLATPMLLPPPGQAQSETRHELRVRERMSYQELHERLLEEYAPPSVVVNQDYEILHLSEHAGRYMRIVGGEPTQNLLKVARPEILLELHSVLYHATQRRVRSETLSGPVTIDGRPEMVKIVVSPVFDEADPSRGLILVVFGPSEMVEDVPEAVPDATQGSESIVRQLEEELARLKTRLRTTIEQHELQQEELKASNEELQAMNEELRSSSEELETSKEELQSVNEELTTVNQELKIKIDELSHANNDTRNLMNSTDIATLFIDRRLRIKLFTPRVRTLFNVIASDAGRPLLDITHKLEYPDMTRDVEHVLDTLEHSEREVRSSDGDWFIARGLPYRTVDDRIAGVVLTFNDITERKAAEDAVAQTQEHVRLVMESVHDYAIFTTDVDGLITSWNSGATDIFGYAEAEVLGRAGAIIFTPEDRSAGRPEEEMRQARENGHANDERWHLRRDGTRIFVSGVMAPLRSTTGLVGFTKIARDLTQRMKYDDELRKARDELEARVVERTDELAQANESLRLEIAERIEAQEARVQLLRQVVDAQEKERSRISRELHDQLGQEVTGLGLKLAALRATPKLANEVRAEIEKLEALVKEIDADVEFLVWELRPTGLDDLGISEALSDYVANWSRYYGVKATLLGRLARRPAPDVETVLYRIAQECLNNVAKHARATKVELDLAENDDHVMLAIRDNGVGFDVEHAMKQKTLGLIGSRERAALVGGTYTIESGRRGTITKVRVPLDT